MSALAPIIIGAIGTGAEVIGNVSAGNARARAAEADAATKRQQAEELLSRAKTSEVDIRRGEAQFLGAQRDAFGYTGFAADSGILLSSLEETQAAADRQVLAMRSDAEFRAKQLRAGADISSKLASDYSATGWLTGAGAAFSGVYGLGRESGWWTPKASPTSLKNDVAGRAPAASPDIDKWDPFVVGRAYNSYRGPAR